MYKLTTGTNSKSNISYGKISMLTCNHPPSPEQGMCVMYHTICTRDKRILSCIDMVMDVLVRKNLHGRYFSIS
jgi:hypothetical protein